jgi:ubiquitin-conjugating enzyme E2 variant
MSQQQQMMEGRSRPETSRGHYILEVLGIAAFFVLALFIGVDIYRGRANFGYLWLLPLLVVLAYLAADLLSGFVHFLADNFGSPETPVI